MPVRSELTQPELPSVAPIRLLPREVKAARGVGPAVLAVFPGDDRVAQVHRGRAASVEQAAAILTAELPLTVQLVSVALAVDVEYRPPPYPPAKLPLTVQLVNVVAPYGPCRGRRRAPAELPLTVQSVSVVVPLGRCVNIPPPTSGPSCR